MNLSSNFVISLYIILSGIKSPPKYATNSISCEESNFAKNHSRKGGNLCLKILGESNSRKMTCARIKKIDARA